MLFSGGYYLLIRFYRNHTFFLTPERSHFPKKNILHQFKPLVGATVVLATSYPNDRAFYIRFSNGSDLHVQCFGRHSGILMVNGSEVVDSFKNLKPEPEFHIPQKEIFWSSDINEFGTRNKFISPETLGNLQHEGFFNCKDQAAFWQSYVSRLNQLPIRIYRTQNGGYGLSLYAHSEELDQYRDISSALHDFARLYISKSRFEQLRQELTQGTEKEINHLNKRLKKVELHLRKLQSRTSFKEVADVLMANLHQIPSGSDKVELLNFYTGQQEVISLKKDLSPQKNAERYYQKAKNSHLELQYAQNQVKDIKNRQARLSDRLMLIEKATTTKELQQLSNTLHKTNKKSKEQKELPYRSFHNGSFDIWVGKNAKSNDVLLKMAQKNDVWLHAREVAGSHVLIKNPEGKKLPESVIEFAASLAAKFSKSKNDGLTAVIYTSPKFVRKFKGALPGQVKVDREDVILVEPYKE